jgi:hypothetical protein
MMSGFSWKLVLAVAIGVNFSAVIYAVCVRYELRQLEFGRPIEGLSGIDLHGKNWVSSASAPCHVVRVTRDECIYCALDKPSYVELIDEALKYRCEIVEIAPRPGQMRENQRTGVVQLKYVDYDLGRGRYVTPETFVLDKRLSVRWSRRGAMDATSLRKAKGVLKSLGEPL